MTLEKTYKIVEMYKTIQGEGFWAGHSIFLIRFKGCNVWTGKESDRHKAKAMCGLWCDTNFVDTKKEKNGGTYTLDQLEEYILTNLSPDSTPIILLTGGEPLLQIDANLLTSLVDMDFRVHIETNGSQSVEEVIKVIRENEPFMISTVWVTVSPKPPLPLHPSVYELPPFALELKCVFDKQMDVHAYDELECYARYIQPVEIDGKTNLQQCIDFVMENGQRFALTTQAHKVWKIE
jgi:7-carboxy-7-deazaguanine synthase